MIKLSSKMRLFAIISSALIVIGLAMGTVFHFISDSFFNYGVEYKDYKSVTVTYYYTEFDGADEIEQICEKAFEDAGIKNFAVHTGVPNVSNEITYKFSASADDKALSDAVAAINTKISEETSKFNDIPQSRAIYHDEKAVMGGETTLSMAAIVLAVIVAVHAIYSLIRYKLTGLCAAAVAQLHNFALFAAVLALCRIPISSSVLIFAIFVALITAVCVTFTFEKIIRNRKEEDEKLSISEIADISAGQTFKTNLTFCAFLALAAILFFVLMSVSSMSLTVILSPVLCALSAFVVGFYGSVLFAPSVFVCFNKTFAKSKEKPLKNKSK